MDLYELLLLHRLYKKLIRTQRPEEYRPLLLRAAFLSYRSKVRLPAVPMVKSV